MYNTVLLTPVECAWYELVIRTYYNVNIFKIKIFKRTKFYELKFFSDMNQSGDWKVRKTN